MDLKICNIILQTILKAKPMNNFMCKPSAERERVIMVHIDI